MNQLLTLIDGADATMGGITGDEEDEEEDNDDSDETGQRLGGHEKSSNQVSHTFFLFSFYIFDETNVPKVILSLFT